MASNQKVNILLVDDQPANLLSLSAMLEDMGENLVEVDSGTKALKALLDNDFALILLDVQMPGLDGFETATLIREREKSRYTPIIFLTALSRNEINVFKGYEIGAVDYLFKPIVPEILRSKVSVFVELFRKTEEVKQQARELERLIRQNQLILDSAAEGVFGVDLQGRSTFANPAAAKLIGRTVEELVGEPIHDRVHPSTSDGPHPGGAERCSLLKALSGADMIEVDDDCFWRSDGSNFPVEYSVTPMRDEQGLEMGAVITFRDVTERRAASKAVENERLYREAQAANKAKDDFLATLSHELRTPMTAILGWVQMLRMGELDAESLTTGLATIESSARLQAQLIDDMLDVSRMILNKFRLDVRRVGLQAIVEAAVDTVRLTAEAKSISLSVAIDAGAGEVMGDPGRLRQVVWNLLSNAIKFSEQGGKVDVRLESSESEIQIRVSDSGQGISPALIPFVFERLRQAEGLKSHGGLGLGLAIARHIIELHGGEINAESEGEGKGATFTVSLPLAEQSKLFDGEPERRERASSASSAA